MTTALGGPPLKYETPELMEKEIAAYFAECDEKKIPYTVTGLALSLGFTSRQALINYEGRDGFIDVIKRAKMRVQNFAEQSLWTVKNPSGIMFHLKNNFGWKDDKSLQIAGQIDHTVRHEVAGDDRELLKQVAQELARRRLEHVVCLPVVDDESVIDG